MYWPLGRDDVPMTGLAEFTRSEYEVRAVTPFASVALIATGNKPDSVGVPMTVAVAGLKVKNEGNVGALHVNGAVPVPGIAENACE